MSFEVIFARYVRRSPSLAPRLLAHEVTHTIQQRRGEIAPSPGGELSVSEASDPLESKADQHADTVMRGDVRNVRTAIAPTVMTSPPSVTGVIQRQAAATDPDPSTYEPGDEKILVDRPRRPGQMQRAEFLERFEERAPHVVLEELSSAHEPPSGGLDIRTIVKSSLHYALAEFPDAEWLNDCLRSQFPSEFNRFAEVRIGIDRTHTDYISTADSLLRAVEDRLRENLQRGIDDLRDRYGGSSPEQPKDVPRLLSPESLPHVIEHAVVEVLIRGGGTVRPTRRQQDWVHDKGKPR